MMCGCYCRLVRASLYFGVLVVFSCGFDSTGPGASSASTETDAGGATSDSVDGSSTGESGASSTADESSSNDGASAETGDGDADSAGDGDSTNDGEETGGDGDGASGSDGDTTDTSETSSGGLPDGEPCTANDECLGGYCYPPVVLGESVCQSSCSTVAGPCDDTTDCCSGSCVVVANICA